MIGIDGDHGLEIALGGSEIVLGLQDTGAQDAERYWRLRLAPPWRQRTLSIADEAWIGLGNADAQLACGEVERKIGIARMLRQRGRFLADRLEARIGARQHPLENLICGGRGERR